MSETPAKPRILILFDGPCGLCKRFVRFIQKRDPNGRFEFAPLQSPIGQQQLGQHNVDPAIQSVVVIENDQAYVRSAAVCRIALELPDPWPLVGAAIFLPEPLRDGVYDWIAAHRRQWFGEVQDESCAVDANQPAR